MSTLKVTNIQSNGAGFNDVVSFQNSSGTQNGTLCRAWVFFNGTFATSPFTIANGGIRASFNVSSITDNGTGDYTINLTTAVPDTNGAITSGKANDVTNAGNATGVAWMSTSSIAVVNYEGGSKVDSACLYFAIFR